MTEKLSDNECKWCHHFFFSSGSLRRHEPYCDENPDKQERRPLKKSGGSGPKYGWNDVADDIKLLSSLKEEKQMLLEELRTLDDKISEEEQKLVEKARRTIERTRLENL